MSDMRDLLPPIPVSMIQVGPGRRVVVSILDTPGRRLIRLAAERETSRGWIPSRGIVLSPAQVDEVARLLKLAVLRAERPEPMLADRR